MVTNPEMGGLSSESKKQESELLRIRKIEVADPSSYEDKDELQKVIRELKSLMEEEKEKLEALDNSKVLHGDLGFIASIDGIEITPSAIAAQKEILAGLEEREEVLQEKARVRRRARLQGIRSFFSILP